MSLSFPLVTLASYLAGEFENREQAIAEPAWYVNLRLWLRPVPDLWSDSLTLFAEQASTLKLDQPYRPRLLRLRQAPELVVEHYMFKELQAFIGSGRQPEKLKALTLEQIEFLPGCTLKVQQHNQQFQALPQPGETCCFQYQGSTYQVSLGFEVNEAELSTYDRGIDSATGKAIWGAILGPYRFKKLQHYYW
ncbi:chromophore lyase CpcT/CpeT [Gloeocapsa sp. PCC 73106]|uniref:chromophore lyase CpcT/CpeT n=1 Tax=Gloeocapsa sp. PCC 73106 TaxID=102232 RepID=UPI0002ACC2F0|nr:chromophore lyase CpcT/CpeT [Gloeocapsa sp. PCC 73106]ELR96845.1 CpeT/CpcT family (DUF1001) [Gloeocapsa sp. PCC 73106]